MGLHDPSPVSALSGPFSAAFRPRSTFVAGAFLQASRDGGARESDLDGRAPATPRPDRRTAMGRSQTTNAGASTALSLREKLRRPPTTIRMWA